MLDPLHVLRGLVCSMLIGFSLGVLGAGGSILTVPVPAPAWRASA